MPYPEAHVESSLPPLGSALRAALEGPALAEFLRGSLQIRELRCLPGLPRRATESALQRWLSAPHVFVKLGSGAHFDASVCEVALPAEQAVELVDRVLGGSGRGVVPGRAGLPNAAECGVLAYFAARCVRACAVDLRVQDVLHEHAPHASAEDVLWPIRVVAGDVLKLDLKLVFRDPSFCPTQHVSAKLVVVDALEAPGEELQHGDLLVSDAWPLHVTASGLSGLLELSVAGSTEHASILLEADALRLSDCALPVRAADSTELVLSSLTLSFTELADLLSARSLPCRLAPEVALIARGETLARGRLVRFSGQLALEVASYSTR